MEDIFACGRDLHQPWDLGERTKLSFDLCVKAAISKGLVGHALDEAGVLQQHPITPVLHYSKVFFSRKCIAADQRYQTRWSFETTCLGATSRPLLSCKWLRARLLHTLA